MGLKRPFVSRLSLTWFSLAHISISTSTVMCKQAKTGSTYVLAVSTGKKDKFVLLVCLCLCRFIGHLNPYLMRAYQKQYGGHFVRHRFYDRVGESWYRELSQICHSARACVLMLML